MGISYFGKLYEIFIVHRFSIFISNVISYFGKLYEIFIEGGRYKYIIQGLTFSLEVTALAAVIGVVLGIVTALFRLTNFKPFYKISNNPHSKIANFNPMELIAVVYVDLIRGTPAVVQLMILANIVFVGILKDVPVLFVAALAFGINSGAYVSEIIRAGIQGLDKGQMEAARSLGLNYSQSMKYVIIPQAIKNILPTLVSEFIILLKETSIVGFIGGMDLLRSANIITSQTYRGVEPLLAVGIIYLAMTALFTFIMRKVERRLRQGD